MAVRIGNAVCSETGGKYGKKGNQTGKELRIQNYYVNGNSPWTHVIRAKDSKVAEKLAKTMTDACNNMHAGYSQDITDRTSLYTLAKKKSWKIAKVKEDCACDCSSLVAVCVNASGIEVSKDMYTGNELEILKATKQFDILTDTKYTSNSRLLMVGDILLKKGHTAIVLDDGIDVHRFEYFAKYKGTSSSIVDALNSLGENSAFSARKQIAKANGISLYVGTANQNIIMLNLLKEGNLIRP